ncbi:SAF-like family protein [Burkholderia cepacia]|uniref:SAF-like family protein n=2 Tax=Burkholderia cepacia TaxID=292 RepID=A0AA89CGW4_BURCE|nr:SAF-like family protein [Burkholderia cepacia]
MQRLTLPMSSRPDRTVRCPAVAGFALGIALLTGTPATIAGIPTPPVEFHTAAYIDGTVVRLGDVADLSRLPVSWRARATEVVVARLRAHDTRVDISAARLAESARRQLPALTPWMSASEAQIVAIVSRKPVVVTGATSNAGAAHRADARCLMLTRDISRSAAVGIDDVRPFACPTDRTRLQALHYDRSAQLMRAPTNLAAGEIIADVARQRLARVKRGEPIEMVTRSGIVTVTRAGVARLDSAPGRPVMLIAGRDEAIIAPAAALQSR